MDFDSIKGRSARAAFEGSRGVAEADCGEIAAAADGESGK